MSTEIQPQLIWGLPDSSLFAFPPINAPAAIPPPRVETPTVAFPFNIPEGIFGAALDARVPIGIALTYAVTVKLTNRYNLSNNKKPWAISKTRIFRYFVVLHNVFLAVYSAWTCWGMFNGLKRSLANPFGPDGVAATADTLCHLHGEAGVANPLYYDEANSVYTGFTPAAPNSMGAGGRMWTEGLAYYGWIFYLSKFYEVLDTFIILAKGKPSSTLQTYHHAGAMMCMWAGIRYMSAPIWVFVLVNSFIHALMYTYYTVTAFSIKVPMMIKRTLTTMQITQFLLGASYAMVHSFVSIVVPVTVTTESVIPGEPVVNSPTASTIPAAAGAFDSFKQFVFGAAPAAASKMVVQPAASQTITTSEVVQITQPCIATSGETLAIWLNVFYLAPLTYLFMSFFVASYMKRTSAASKSNNGKKRRQSNVTIAEKAGWDAAKGLEKEIYNGESMMNGSAVSDEEPGTPEKMTKSRR